MYHRTPKLCFAEQASVRSVGGETEFEMQNNNQQNNQNKQNQQNNNQNQNKQNNNQNKQNQKNNF